MNNKRLTGNFYFRKNFFGAMVLYVEEQLVSHGGPEGVYFFKNWRRAKECDAKELNLQPPISFYVNL